MDLRPTLKLTPLPESVIKLQFLNKSRPRAWTLAVLVLQKSSAPLGAHNEQPAIPGTRTVALGIVASSSPGLFFEWDEPFASHRCPVSAAESSCCPHVPLLAAAGWGGAGQGLAWGEPHSLFIDQTTTKLLCTRSRVAEPPVRTSSPGLYLNDQRCVREYFRSSNCTSWCLFSRWL